MQPFKLASGGTLLTQTPKLQPSGMLDDSAIQQAANAPMLRGPSEGLIAPKQSVQPIVVDALPAAIAGTTNVLVNEAFKLEDRMQQLNADEAVVNFRKKAGELLNGSVGDDGSLQGGYANTKMKDAMTNLGGYRTSLEELTNSTLDELPPAARAKALLRIKATGQDYDNQGVHHYQRETQYHEKNIRDQDEQMLQQEISEQGMKPFLNGRVDEVLSRYPVEAERIQKQESLVRNAIADVYKKAHAEASKDPMNLTPALTAQNAVVNAYNEIQPRLPVELDTKVYDWLEQQKGVAERQAKAVEAERRERLTFDVKKEAPQRFGEAIYNEKFEDLSNDIAAYKAVIKDPEVASDNVMKSLKEALYTVTKAKGGVTFEDEKIFIQSQGSKMLKTLKLDPNETGKLIQMIEVDLPKQIYNERNFADQDELNRQAYSFAAVREVKFTPGQKLTAADLKRMPPQPEEHPPIDMLPENKAKWYKLTEDAKKTAEEMSKGDISRHTPERAHGLFVVYRDGLKDGSPLTEGQQDHLRMWLLEKSITKKEYEEAMGLHKNVDTANERKPAWMKTESYKAVLATVNASEGMFAGAPKPYLKPGAKRTMGKEQELYEWNRQAEIGKAQFRDYLENEGREAIKAGKPFSPDAVLLDYVKTRLNNGSIAIPVTFGERLRNLSDLGHGLGTMPLGKRLPLFTGEQPSIMDDVQ